MENFFKIFLIICLFLSTFFIFKILQRPKIYNATLKKITHTYVRDLKNKNFVWKTHQPYYYRDSLNTLRWDGGYYWGIKKSFYENNEKKYAFFPFFPLIWKILNISNVHIGLFNYLLFGISVLIFSILFYKEKVQSLSERLCVFIVAMILPTVVVFYLPYAEAVFTLTFAMAMWGLIKNKYWVYFISIFLFSMTRPIFMHVGLAFLFMDSFYFFKHKNGWIFVKEIILKLLPLVLGTLVVFIVFYIHSGSFFKYFEVINTYWKTNFSIPHHISDWSIESFGMNVFIIFFIIIPSLVLFFNYLINLYFSKNKFTNSSIFDGNVPFIQEYFFNISIVYFSGVLVYTLFFQNGSLNGLNRYILASPFSYIFFFYTYQYLKELKITRFLLAGAGLLIAGLFMLTGFKTIESQINFSDSGFFILLTDLIFLFSLQYLNNIIRLFILIFIIFINLFWITYLYNIYLCDGWIFT